MSARPNLESIEYYFQGLYSKKQMLHKVHSVPYSCIHEKTSNALKLGMFSNKGSVIGSQRFEVERRSP